MLVPTWPVVITLTDVLMRNRDPMELGLQYSWRYWKSVQDLNSEGHSDADGGDPIADLYEESQNADTPRDQ